MQQKIDRKKAKVFWYFFIITLLFLVFLATLFYWATIDRRLPKLQTSEGSTALRGDILSKDGYTIATSKKLYKVMVDTRNIDPDKLDLFVKLYSIYSNDDPKRVKRLIKSNKANVILSYKLDTKTAKYIQELSRKLIRLKVFKAYEDPKSKTAFLRGMSVVESGEMRVYPNKDILSPYVGYVKKIEKNDITKVKGVKGIEYFYEDKLSPIQDALLIGPKDIGNTVILNRNSDAKKRIDGYNVALSISIKLQKSIENILDVYKEKLQAKEVLAAVIDSKSGEFVALASSNRFDPQNIQKNQYSFLNPTLTEYSYEPGSVIKAVTLALLLREDKVNPYDIVNTYNGKYKLGRSIIRDSHAYEYLSVEDIVVYSSNIGMLQIAQKLEPTEYFQGLKDFGFALKTPIDLPYVHSGTIPSLSQFRSSVYKATVGYGYGLQTTFLQILQAFNVFNDNGKLSVPHLGVYMYGSDGKKHKIKQVPKVQVLPISISKRIHKILVKTVQKGTGKSANVDGLQIGGKTGTAHIAINGKYANIYNGSFVGFANDLQNKYTIGVLTREPKKRYYYFGSLSAAPVFKQIVLKMVEEGFLKPQINDENTTK